MTSVFGDEFNLPGSDLYRALALARLLVELMDYEQSIERCIQPFGSVIRTDSDLRSNGLNQR